MTVELPGQSSVKGRGQIHAYQPAAQPEFLEQDRVRVPGVRCQQAPAQGGADVGVGHRLGRAHGPA